MERLTKVIDNGRIVTNEAEARSYGETDEEGYFFNYFTGEAITKLARYEDTGYEPEEIAELAANAAARDIIINKLEGKIEEMESRIRFYQKKVNRLAAYEDLEEQGRLVVLPCKVGDTVYVLKDTELFTQTVVPLRVQGISVTSDNRDIVLHFGGFPFFNAFGSSIGKRVFLSRAEAEKAMEVSEDTRKN